MLYLCATGGQLEPTILRAGVVSLLGSYLGAHPLQGLYKYVAAGPAFGQHQHLRGAAQKRGIHEKGSGGILGLIAQFLAAVRSRYDDERRDVPEQTSISLSHKIARPLANVLIVAMSAFLSSPRGMRISGLRGP
jgi:hypothetical protein